MSRTITIGVGPGGAVEIDVDVLLRSRLLITANSGGGKSWLMRLIAEQLCPLVQTFVVDPEGEFATLREHFPFVLVGPGGETPARISTAKQLAHKLLKLRASAIFDLYELDPAERIEWVATFFSALIDAPKSLWHQLAILIDEAHMFAPEGKEGAASEAVAAIATRGRKRGYGLIAGTLRLSDFSKSVASGLQNVMVGPTFMDLDLERSAKALSIGRGRKELGAFFEEMKVMEPGHFYALGRAISKQRILMEVGDVRSSHPAAGEEKLAPPPPPATLKKILAELSDLPSEADSSAAGEEELRAENARLRAELATGPGRADMVAKISQDAVALAAERDRLRGEVAAFEGATPAELRRLRHLEQSWKNVAEAVKDHDMDVEAYPERFAPPPVNGQPITNMRPLNRAEREYLEHAPRVSEFSPVGLSDGGELERSRRPSADVGGLIRCPREILAALAARHPTPLTKVQLATLAGYAPSGGGFNNAMGELKGKNLIERDGDSFAITAAGLKMAPRGQVPRTPAELVDFWCSKLTGRARDMLRLLSRSRKPLTKEEIAREVGMEVSAGGFNNYLGTLRSNGLAQKTRGGFEAAASLVVR